MAIRTTAAVVAVIALLAAYAIFRTGDEPGQSDLGQDVAEQTDAPCQTSSNGYTVLVCIETGPPRPEEDNSIPVVVTVTLDGTDSGVRRINTYLNNEHLLEDVAAPYEFLIPADEFPDGDYTLEVDVLMRDSFLTPRIATTITLDGDQTSPVATADFSPTPLAPTDGAPFVFAAVGDGAGGRPESQAVADLVKTWNPSLFAYLGDVYDEGSVTEFYNWYGHDGSYFDAFRSITAPVLGNHEWDSGDSPGYVNYWQSSNKFYSFDANGWHFIALDSNRVTEDSEQYQWLKADLSANDAACTVALFHHPVLSVGQHGARTELNSTWALLSENGVDFVLTGHDHQYQRWTPLDGALNPDPGGMVEFVVGNGGHGIRPTTSTDDRVAATSADPSVSVGALRMELNPGGANYAFINTDGIALDAGALPCRGAVDTTAPTAPGNLSTSISDKFDLELSWEAATDDGGISTYKVFRDSELLGEIASVPTRFVDFDADPDTTYLYEIVALDPLGNVSEAGSISVTMPGFPETLVLEPTADAYVSSENPSKLYGSADVLRTDKSPDVRTYIRFEITGLPSAPEAVVLRLHANSRSAMGFDVHQGADESWDELEITYSNAPAFDPSVLAPGGPTTAGGYVEIDVSSVVTGDGEYTFVLIGTSDTGISLASRESPTPPQLVISSPS